MSCLLDMMTQAQVSFDVLEEEVAKMWSRAKQQSTTITHCVHFHVYWIGYLRTTYYNTTEHTTDHHSYRKCMHNSLGIPSSEARRSCTGAWHRGAVRACDDGQY
jgi:hypothetical protein